MSNYEQIDQMNELVEDFIEHWDACCDYSEYGLAKALNEAGENNQLKLAREVMEGAILYVIEELVLGTHPDSLGIEAIEKIIKLRNCGDV